MDRRKFLAASLAALPLSRAAQPKIPAGNKRFKPPTPFELQEVSISQLQQGFRKRTFTCERIAQAYLSRIEELDRKGPALRSVIEINPDALETARSLDEEYGAKGPRSALHGIPVLLKDNIDTGDRMQTSAGSLALVGSPAPCDAWLVKRLRAAGALILGKTNLSEWANFRSIHSTSGWSARGGQTKHPYALDRNPCGSSSGSAVAVSSNLCAVAIGTETDGSIVCPSSMCGIVGLKPTLGLVSRSGVIPIAHSQDTAGPMARSVRDTAILLNALAAVDPGDQATLRSGRTAFSDYTKFLDPKGLQGARIGVAREYFRLTPGMIPLMESCLDVIRNLGAELIDPVRLPDSEEWRPTETQVLLYEFKADLNSYLANRKAPVKTLADCIRFNREHRAEEMPYFEQDLMEQAEAKGPLTEKAYKEALAANLQLTRKEGLDAVMRNKKLDAIIAPTTSPAWLTDWTHGDHVESGCASAPAVAGYPHLTVPAGLCFGLPVGLSFFGSAWSEPKLLKYAYAFEQSLSARQLPRFLPSIELA